MQALGRSLGRPSRSRGYLSFQASGRRLPPSPKYSGAAGTADAGERGGRAAGAANHLRGTALDDDCQRGRSARSGVRRRPGSCQGPARPLERPLGRGPVGRRAPVNHGSAAAPECASDVPDGYAASAEESAAGILGIRRQATARRLEGQVGPITTRAAQAPRECLHS